MIRSDFSCNSIFCKSSELTKKMFKGCELNAPSLDKGTLVIMGSSSKVLGKGTCTVIICQSCFTERVGNSSSSHGDEKDVRRGRRSRKEKNLEGAPTPNASAPSVDWKQCPCQDEECRVKWSVTQDLQGIKQYKKFSGCEDIRTFCCKQHYGAFFSSK